MAHSREKIDASELELKDTVVNISRVTKVVKGGKNLSFSALVVVGDGNGRVGLGYGKAKEVPLAIQKGTEEAKKNLFDVPLAGSTITHPIIGINSAETLTIDCTPSLGSSETLDDVSGSDGYGNTLGASVSDGDLDFEAPVVNTGTITSARTGATIAVGKAVQIRVIGAGFKPGKTYTLKIVMTTS